MHDILVLCSWTTLRVRQSGTTQVIHPLECRQAPAAAGSTRGAALQRTIVLCTLGKARGTSQDWTRDSFVVSAHGGPTVPLPEGWRPKLTPRSAQVYGWMCQQCVSVQCAEFYPSIPIRSDRIGHWKLDLPGGQSMDASLSPADDSDIWERILHRAFSGAKKIGNQQLLS